MDSEVDLVIHSLPQVLRDIRMRAGFRTLAAAEEGIEKRTGRKITRSMLSKYERGDAQPGWSTLVVFLAAMGTGLAGLEHSIERLLAEQEDDATGRVGRALAAQAEHDSSFRSGLLDLLASTSAAGETCRELVDYQEHLRSLNGSGGLANP